MPTIAAIATPTGTAGIAVIRVSGDEALRICCKHLQRTPAPFHTCHTTFATDGETIDDVVATYYAAPRSYTGEDVVEISCHGSLYIQQTILAHLIDSGCALAEPGEFTRRAFVNGRLNLSQAEAIADLIESATPAQHQLAISQLRGGYARQLGLMREQLLDLTSLLELELDFSQEDVEFADRSQLHGLLNQLHGTTSRLIQSFRIGNAVKHGIPVAIIGPPNAGKSSLLNALLHDERAIVCDTPGTTRDTIEEPLTIEGLTFRFIDTAGLHATSDNVEKIGIERSIAAASKAMVILYVADVTDTSTLAEELGSLCKQVEMSGKYLILVRNKCDLMSEIPPVTCNLPAAAAVHVADISVKDGRGIERLLQLLRHNTVEFDSYDILLTNTRHYNALRNILQALEQVRQGLSEGIPSDLLSVDLRDALYHLGTITGEVTPDDILSNIFSRFCVGK